MIRTTYKRGLALLLTLCLLLVCIPAVTAEEPQTAEEPYFQIVLEPKYAVDFNRFYGNYCKYNDYSSNSAGVCDCFGNVTMSGKGFELEPFPNGMAKEMGRNEEGYLGWAILSPTGKRLTDYTSGGEVGCAKDWYTGKVYNWVYADFGGYEKRIDFNGKDPFAGKYDTVNLIWNGKFACCKDGKWGIDALDGTQILPRSNAYEYLELCDLDRCIFTQNGKKGIMDLKGKVLLPALYDDLWNNENRTGYYATLDGKWGAVSKDLRQVVPCIYDGAGCFSENLFEGTNYGSHRETVLYDADGNITAELKDVYSDYTSEDRAFMYHFDNGDGTGTYTVLNLAGETVVDSKIAARGVCAAELLLFEVDGNTEVYDGRGTLINTIENSRPENLQGRIPIVSRDGKYAVVGTDGKPSTDFVYTQKTAMPKDNVICMPRDGRYYLITRSGKEFPEGGCDREVIFGEDSDYAGFTVNGYSGVVRYVGLDDSRFADVKNDAWYRAAADYCAEKGLMAGTAPGKFSPDVTTTRSMLVTILYSISGAAAPTGDNPFTDVKDGQWYTPAVLWAAETGIVSGYGNGKFGPNDPVTREQIAAILYSYAKKYGLPVSGSAALDTFPDTAKVSTWAKDAVSWAVANGLISGSVINGQTCLDPQGKATRAMLACIMMRFTQLSD